MSPAEFSECVAKGGRVRTKKLGEKKYIYVCFDKKGSHASEVHVKK